MINDRRSYLKTFPFFCDNCKKFTHALIEYCENCGTNVKYLKINLNKKN